MKLFRTIISGAGLLTVSVLLAFSAYASYPQGYYNSLNGKCGHELLKAVGKMADGHKNITYNSGTWDAFATTDVKVVGGRSYWWDMYSNNMVETSSGHSGLNIEHSVAKSWWGGTKNLAHNDIVHLNPSNAEANNRKSNYPISELQTVKWDNGVTFVGVPKSGQGGGSSWGYEPADEYKGDFARVFMYMFCTYWDLPWQDNTAWMYSTSGNHELKEWAYELMIRWSNSDPVSEKERNRNDGVQQEQRNRNPFIDLPDLADHIWGDKKNEPYKVEGSGEDPEDPEGTTAIFNWLGENDADGSAGWDFDNTNLPSDLDYIWSWKEYNGKYYLNASAYKGGNSYKAEAYAWSEPVNMTNAESATFSFEHAAKFQTTLRTLCKVAVKDVATGEVTLVDIPNYPNSGVWTFAQSGDIDLTGFVGKNIRVGFRYGSEDGAADTWEIKNAKLTVKQTPSGVELMPDPDAYDDSEMVEVWGNNILVPEGAVIYNLSGVAVNGENLPRGIYVVTKPSFSKAVKVMIK